MVIRKRLNIDIQDLAFVTTTVRNWDTIFSHDGPAELTLRQLAETTSFYKSSIIAYCLMPSHLHAIINLMNIKDLSKLIGSFKSLSSRLIKEQYPKLVIEELIPANSFHLWKPRFDDFILRNIEQLRIKMTYIHENPVRARFVENPADWKYSSARDWLLDEKGIIEIDKRILG